MEGEPSARPARPHPPHEAVDPAPDPTSPAQKIIVEEPRCSEPPLSALNSWITPTERFFVRSHFPVPRVDVSTWRLIIDGEVAHPLSLSFEEVRRLAARSVVATMECAGNSRSVVQPPAEGVRWDHGALGTARWTGIALRDLLVEAQPLPTAREAVFEGADHGREPGIPEELSYAMSVPIAKAQHPDTLLAFEMNGAPLTAPHGFPARLVVPDWYGMASVKWVTRVQLIDHAFRGYYRTRPYVFIHEGDDPEVAKKPVMEMQVKSLITWPRQGITLPPGRHTLRGVAWSGLGAIRSVEVTTDPYEEVGEASRWDPAVVLGPSAPHAWVRWEHTVTLERPGYYVLRARATDDQGNVQPLRAAWNFRGVATNSVHAVPLIIRPEAPA